MVNHIAPETLTNRVSGHGRGRVPRCRRPCHRFRAQDAEVDFPAMIIKIDLKWTSSLVLQGRSEDSRVGSLGCRSVSLGG